MILGHALQDVLEIDKGLHVIKLCRGDEGANGGPSISATVRAGEQMVLAPKRDGSDRAFAGRAITESFDLSGFIGGGQLGCNWQFGAWVFGIEGDGSATNKSGQGIELSPIPRPNTLWISETQERWFVTARGRLGLTNFWGFGDKTLLYVTGGGAWAKIDASEWLSTNPQSTGHQESNTRSGWTAGGGIEYALGYGWSVKSEFLYADFGTYTTFTSPPFASTNIQPRDVKVKDYIWRAGMNYKFW